MTRRIAGAVVLLGLLSAAVIGVRSGWSFVVLVSPSMEPFASPGDLLVQRRVPADDITTGDVVTVRTTDERLATHRVVRLVRTEGDTVIVRLKGDASRLPDPVPVTLAGEVSRVDAVVPRVGSVLTVGAPLLWGGLGLLAVGSGALVAVRWSSPRPSPSRSGRLRTPGRKRAAPPPDPRLAALLATCEQFAEDGMPDVVLRDLVRVRTADLLGLPSAERAGAIHALGDGARFYVIALADADPTALARVPPHSERRRRASAALDLWWLVVGRRLPPAVAEQIAPWLER